MSERIYNPQDLTSDEEPFSIRFEQLKREFGNFYQIFVVNEDGGRIIGAGVAKLDPETNVPTVVVKLRFRRQSKYNPLTEEVIQQIWSHLCFDSTEDLEIEC